MTFDDNEVFCLDREIVHTKSKSLINYAYAFMSEDLSNKSLKKKIKMAKMSLSELICFT